MGQPMNREQKRMMRRGGQPIDDEGNPKPVQREPRPKGARKPRVGPVRFLREVASEMRKVSWPKRREVLNYTWVTLIALTFVGTLIFIFDSAFLRSARFLFK